MKSVASMITQLAALLDTSDLSPWEQKFIADIDLRTGPIYSHSQTARYTLGLTAAQVDRIEQIYTCHFGDAHSA